MASAYNHGMTEIVNGGIDYLTNTIKIMLVDATYTFNKDDQFVDELGANDPIDQELSGTGYTAGYAGTGRKTLASKSVTKDTTNDRVIVVAANPTWTALNVATDAAAGIVHKHGAADDTTGILMWFIDGGGFPINSNGGDVTIDWASAGTVDGIAYLQN